MLKILAKIFMKFQSVQLENKRTDATIIIIRMISVKRFFKKEMKNE